MAWTEYQYDYAAIETCGRCKKKIINDQISYCHICKIKLCPDCIKAGICIDHYNLLTSDGKREYHDYWKRRREYETNSFCNYGIIIGIYALFLMLIPTLMSFTFISFIIMFIAHACVDIPILIFYGREYKSRGKEFDQERTKIFEEYGIDQENKS